ncbi:Uncharacterized protein FWK35_00024797 [Aphis craccivora]|uniref:Uncharacterized protein n=1 Tax=Aphis craccivora TaxID=307492 RepID=A0A6G0YAG9_APHCR|nr:Uncharacterized protein FWK35_00024797 [Aphis craccivora]
MLLMGAHGLSCISPNEVGDGFVALMTDASYGDETFTEYILETFVDDNSFFQLYLWAESPSSDPKTTNGSESFHRDFNSQFYISHTKCFISKYKYFIILE